MKTELVFTRKHKGEEYEFYTCIPEYAGEKGCLDVELKPYIKVKTPKNCFGYSDYILLQSISIYDENGYYIGKELKAYTLNRYLQPSILKAIEKQMIRLLKTIA